MIAVRRMENPPAASIETIPNSLIERLAALDPPLQIALAIIGEGVKRTGVWVGVSIRDIAVFFRFGSNEELTRAQQVEMGLHILHQPADWFDIFRRSDRTAAAFQAADGKWVTIDAGFAYPTQEAIRLICRPASE